MDRRLRRAIEGWLAGEEAGEPQEAEEALRQALRRLPRLAPPPGFARRVLARAGVVAREAPWLAALGRRRSLQGLLAASLALVGLAVSLLPSVLAPLLPELGSLRLGLLLRWALAAFMAACRWLAEGAAFWRVLAEIGGAASSVAARPSTLALLALSALLSVSALGFLNGLLVSERSSRYAKPI